MHLVQLLLPLRDDAGREFPKAAYDEVARRLTETFGGVTAYSRAPAAGLWQDGGEPVRDDIVVYEVMVEDLDRAWWAAYRRSLEKLFAQQELVVRASGIERL